MKPIPPSASYPSPSFQFLCSLATLCHLEHVVRSKMLTSCYSNNWKIFFMLLPTPPVALAEEEWSHHCSPSAIEA